MASIVPTILEGAGQRALKPPKLPKPDPAPTIQRAPVKRNGVIGTISPGVAKLGGPKPAPPPPPLPAATTQLAGGGAAAAVPPAPPAAPAQPADLTGLIANDDRWTMAQGQGAAALANLYARYGYNPQYNMRLDIPNTPTVDKYGNPTILGYNVASEQDNPNSIINQIARAGRAQIADSTNAQNAHGLLFSGATGAQVANTQREQARQTNDQYLNFLSGINNVGANQQTTYQAIYNELANRIANGESFGAGPTTGPATSAAVKAAPAPMTEGAGQKATPKEGAGQKATAKPAAKKPAPKKPAPKFVPKPDAAPKGWK